MFADAEGKKGGQFYTPRSIVQLLVAMIEPSAAESLTLAVEAAACSFKAKNS
jgi:type I restriction-modification system DNA methylase subunit